MSASGDVRDQNNSPDFTAVPTILDQRVPFSSDKLKLKTHNPVFVVTFVRSKEEGSKGRQQTSNNNRLII